MKDLDLFNMNVKPTTNTHMGGLCGTRSISGTESNLLMISTKAMEDETRVLLLKELMSRNLATFDIYNFAYNQAMVRSVIKEPDSLTIKRAMNV